MATPPSVPPGNELLVEGTDDKYVILRLLEKKGIEPNFHISVKGGADNLLRSISTEFKVSDRKRLGIVLDANDDLNNRWVAISDRLRNEGVSTPIKSQQAGTVIRDSSPWVGIWLMPDNVHGGEIENFVEQMIPSDDPIWSQAQSYINDIPVEDRRFGPWKIRRAQIHAWLATREDPRKMGQAILAGDLDVGVPICNRFIDWLDNLFYVPF